MNTISIVLFASFLIIGSTEKLKCYDCHPEDEGCVYPDGANVKLTVCEEDPSAQRKVNKEIYDIDQLDVIPSADNNTELEYECFSLHYKRVTEDDNFRQGVYRGCIEKTRDMLSSCEYLTDRLDKNRVTACDTCQSNQCNVRYVGGAASITSSVAFLIMNLLIVLSAFTFSF